MAMTPVKYNNTYRGKFSVDVTVRIVLATKNDGMKGFSQVAEFLAEKFKPQGLEEAFHWNPSHLEVATLQKINPTEMNVPPIEEEEPATEEGK